MNYLTIGVIGHVDHGKTTLVKALTGIDTDRLKEEKERGISIALGFANLKLPSGEIGFIDAPGHEKFVRTMIAGATGSEAVLLVIDVNEGVKPQTVEHLEIAKLLGIERGVVAITKCDAAEEDMRELARADLEGLVAGTFLSDAPVIDVSAQTGEGLDALKEVLDAFAAESPPAPDEGYAYLPVDRSFTMSGFGTVVTGTLRGGALHIGDEVEVYPKGFKAKVRQLQSHNQETDTVLPGHRCAVNLRGIEKMQIGRGDALATPGTIVPAHFLDLHLNLLDSAAAPLKQRQIVRILFGTTETFGRAHFLDRDALDAGDSCVLQLQLDEIAAVPAREPFIIRTYSPMRTIGGGRVLGHSHSRYPRSQNEILERLETWARGDLEEMISNRLGETGPGWIEIQPFCLSNRIGEAEVQKCFEALPVTVLGERYAVFQNRWHDFKQSILKTLGDFHAEEPTARGLLVDDLRARLRIRMNDDLLNHALSELEAENGTGLEEGHYRLADFSVGKGLGERERALVDEIASAFKQGGLEPPGIDDVIQGDKDRHRMYRYLLDTGVLTSTHVANKPKTPGNTIVFHSDIIDDAKRRLTNQFAQEGRFDTPGAKNVLGISRKYLIPLLECLDATGFTKRNDNERVLIDK
ncbi:MAG: selenocysteine-specific translation elongation factor [Candidatus Hydrogenedentes bacterium]|nr:selenocysteine-specific translation elongation factor [Candidatus Hydrogenedentota bacterium]